MDAGRGDLKKAQWQRERTGALQAGEMEHISVLFQSTLTGS